MTSLAKSCRRRYGCPRDGWRSARGRGADPRSRRAAGADCPLFAPVAVGASAGIGHKRRARPQPRPSRPSTGPRRRRRRRGGSRSDSAGSGRSSSRLRPIFAAECFDPLKDGLPAGLGSKARRCGVPFVARTAANPLAKVGFNRQPLAAALVKRRIRSTFCGNLVERRARKRDDLAVDDILNRQDRVHLSWRTKSISFACLFRRIHDRDQPPSRVEDAQPRSLGGKAFPIFDRPKERRTPMNDRLEAAAFIVRGPVRLAPIFGGSPEGSRTAAAGQGHRDEHRDADQDRDSPHASRTVLTPHGYASVALAATTSWRSARAPSRFL